jgi:hypothetical protein
LRRAPRDGANAAQQRFVLVSRVTVVTTIRLAPLARGQLQMLNPIDDEFDLSGEPAIEAEKRRRRVARSDFIPAPY